MDAHKNFAYSTVAVAPSPASSGTSLTVATGDGALFPATPFNATVWPTAAMPLATNAEVVRVTNIAGDVLTITRAQESSSARTVVIGDQIAATITAKTLTDVESAAGGAGTNGAITGGSLTVNTSGVSINLPAYLTTADLSANSSKYAGINGAITGGSITVNTSGVSVNLPAYLTTAALSGDTSKYAFTGFTTTTVTGAVVAGTHNTAGLLLAVPSYLTTADLSANSSRYAGVNGAITGGSITVNTSGVSVNLPAYLTTAMQSNAATISNINVSVAGSSNNLSNLVFSNLNGVSFGLAGSTVTGSVSPSTASVITLSVAGSSQTFGNVVFSNSNGVSFGLSGSTVTAAAGPALRYFEVDDEVAFGLMTHVSGINSRPIFVPFALKGFLTASSLIVQVSVVNTSTNPLFTLMAGLYSYVNNTSIAQLGSFANSYSLSQTASYSGIQYVVATGFATGMTALTPGAYVLGLNISGAATGGMNFSLFGGVTASIPRGFIMAGSDNPNTTNTTWGVEALWGRYTANSAGLPANVGQTDVLANFTGASAPLAPWFVLRP
jgi:hypothetical protein